ncbi:MAG TPA: hypothetical protein VHX17_09555 [Candidatus Cybelea sp.]|nr:hypothetical protein [Candidatus Cybelea sp.]
MQKFFSEVLEMRSVDAGEGWPIFAAPPTELAVHETEGEPLGLYEPHHPSPLANVSNHGAGE